MHFESPVLFHKMYFFLTWWRHWIWRERLYSTQPSRDWGRYRQYVVSLCLSQSSPSSGRWKNRSWASMVISLKDGCRCPSVLSSISQKSEDVCSLDGCPYLEHKATQVLLASSEKQNIGVSGEWLLEPDYVAWPPTQVSVLIINGLFTCETVMIIRIRINNKTSHV